MAQLFVAAYYLDYQQNRGTYVGAYFDKLVNWGFCEKNLADATTGGAGTGEL